VGGAARRVPTVVVVGRPNVGKSSLVNRLAGRRVAVVEATPGVTRDRRVVPVEWAGSAFEVVDTGGWLAAGDLLDQKVAAQAERALHDADLVLVVVDVTVGVTDEDLAVARLVRKSQRPVRLVANKVDDAAREGAIWEFVSLGLGEPIGVSALHGRSSGDLLDELVDALADAVPPPPEPEPSDELRVAIVGRPNVGKSTLFNALIGEDRSIVHDEPGTTRDAIDTVVETDDGPIRFIDTAGMRRRAKTEAGVETYAVLRSLEAIDRADLALLVIDGTLGATAQDQRLAERIGAAGCPAVVVCNKWDLVATEEREAVLGSLADRLAFLGSTRCTPRPRRSTTAASRPASSTGRSASSRRTTPPRGPASATPSRARSTRPRSRSSRRGASPSPTCGTSSAGCASGSTSGRPRCGCA